MDRNNVRLVLAEVRMARRLYCVGQYAAAEAALDRAEDTLGFAAAETPDSSPEVEPSVRAEAAVLLAATGIAAATVWGLVEAVSWMCGL